MGIEPEDRPARRRQAGKRPDGRVAVAGKDQGEPAGSPGGAHRNGESPGQFKRSADLGGWLGRVVLDDLELGDDMAIALQVCDETGVHEVLGAGAAAPAATRGIVGDQEELDVHEYENNGPIAPPGIPWGEHSQPTPVGATMPEITRLAAALADRYHIERELGAGGMATVHVARDLKHQREVALKVLRPELAAVLGTERFLHEIQITAQLDHPHILTLIDSGEAGGLLYYVLPLVRGESLRHRLERERQLGVDDALAITRQIAGALEYAHRHGVIHRDIKPENILLHEGEAMLTDFGIALAVREAGGNRLTESGLSLGTPQYMSPEQATGDRDVDARSDIYSLGAVLYEMLAGEPPVTGPTARAMIAKLMTERPTRLRVVRDTVPEGIDAAVARALAKVPADRYKSAGDFAAALGHSGAASSDNAPTQRRWITFTVIGVAALALGLAARIALRGRPTVAPAFTPQFEQLTTDGNARRPGLSPDGTRLAYIGRDCDERERCTDRLVVRDIGGAGSITLLKSRSIRGELWAASGRFLIVGITGPNGRPSTVAVSALGGTLWSLPGWGTRVVGETDTLLFGPGFRPPDDSVAWLRVVTVSDGLVRDSIAIRCPGYFQVGLPASVGGRIALVSMTEGGTVIRLMDRSGRMTDSLPSMTTLDAIEWTPAADAMLLQVDLGTGRPNVGDPVLPPVPTVVVRRRVSAAGKFVGTPDTMLKLEPGSLFEGLRPDGSVLLSQGPVEAVVYALERSGPDRLDFRSRRLISSTAGLQGILSRDGATVWLKRGGLDPASPRRDAFLPFDGGAEQPFNLPPGDEISGDWSRPVSGSLFYAHRDSSGRAKLVEIQVATGLARSVADLPARTSFVLTIPGGGYGIGDIETHSMRVAGRPGRPDTTWTVSAIAGRLITVPGEVAADGTAFFEFSQSSQIDTVWVRRVPLDGGVASPMAPTVNTRWLGVYPDGSFEMVQNDSAGGLGWYRIPPGGTGSVRLGDAPVQGERTTWSASDNGRRFIVVKPVDRPDIFLLRNFGELLRR